MNIELIPLPFGRNGRRNDGDTAFAFLNHPVGNGCAIIDGTNAMRFTGIEHNTLGSCCLTSVNVGNNPNISILLERILTSHS